jgi:hypothetical protein
MIDLRLRIPDLFCMVLETVFCMHEGARMLCDFLLNVGIRGEERL